MTRIAVIGGGPAGLMAAEVLSARGFGVDVYERKPSVGRKFLMAGRGGLNLTHSEEIDAFIARYGARAQALDGVIRAFPPRLLRQWAESLGEETFVGSSGRVFPKSFKASPLLRAWLRRLEKQGVEIHLNYEWTGWDGDALVFNRPEGHVRVTPAATMLALGGASWPRLGSDGAWVGILERAGVGIVPLQPANSGFAVAWSDVFKDKFAGQPLKSIVAMAGGQRVAGEMIISATGVEGGVVYALSRMLRDAGGPLVVDLKPDLDVKAVVARLQKNRGRDSLSSHLRKVLHLSPVAVGLLMEQPERAQLGQYSAEKLAQLVKHCPVRVEGSVGIERAISTAGGVALESLDGNSMLAARPGVFVAGEMMDWEAPTGGYLLQASFATGVYAAQGMMRWFEAGQ